MFKCVSIFNFEQVNADWVAVVRAITVALIYGNMLRVNNYVLRYFLTYILQWIPQVQFSVTFCDLKIRLCPSFHDFVT